MSDVKYGYLYDENTFQFINKIELEVEPIEYKILMPKFCTTIKPPAHNDDEIALYDFVRKKWNIIKDFRGIWYDLENGNEVMLDTIFDVSQSTPNTKLEILKQRIPYAYEFRILTLQDGRKLVRDNYRNTFNGIDYELLEWDNDTKYFRLKKDLTKAKEKIIEKMNIAYQESIKEDIAYNGSIFQVDEKSFNVLQSKILSTRDDANVGILDKDNNFVLLGKNDLKEILYLTEERNQRIFINYQQTKESVKKCHDYKDLEKIYPNFLEILRGNDELKIGQ